MKPFWLFICLFFLSVASTEASLVQTCNQILMTKATDQTHNKKSKSQVNLLEQDQLKDVIILHFLKNNNEPFFLLTVESGLVKLDESVDALYRIISNWAKDSEVKIARHSDLKNDMKSSRKSDRTDKVLYLTFTGSPDEVYLFIEELRLLKPNYSVHVSALNMNKTQVNKVLFAFLKSCANCQLNDEEKLLLKSDEFYDPISGAASAFYEIEDYNLPFSVYFFFKDIADQVWRTEGQKQRVTSQFEQLGLLDLNDDFRTHLKAKKLREFQLFLQGLETAVRFYNASALPANKVKIEKIHQREEFLEFLHSIGLIKSN